MISCKEVFCSELPSPSNIFLSPPTTSSSSCNNDHNNGTSDTSAASITSDGCCYQFASERHLLTVQTSYKDDEERCCGGSVPPKKRTQKTKEYKLLAERLQQTKSNMKITEMEQSSTATATSTTATTCLAHSSLQLNSNNNTISIQAVAIMNESSNTNNTASGGGGGGISSGISHENDAEADAAASLAAATTATTTTFETHHSLVTQQQQQHEAGSNSAKEKVGVVQSSNNNNHYNNSEMVNNKKHTTDNGTTSLTSSKFALMIKYRLFVATENEEGEMTTTTTTMTSSERIHLDFRPISVHVTQLSTSSSSSSSSSGTTTAAAAMDNDDSSLPIIIGIFVAGNDNKMHFFVTTMQVLMDKLFQDEERELVAAAAAAAATTTTSVARISNITSCFHPSFCFESIHPSNLTSTCASNNSSNYFSEEGISLGNNPLVFATPIMAIDTCISEGYDETSSSSSSSSTSLQTTVTTKDTNVNRLAVACYDGVVRILTYTIEYTSDSNIIRIAKLRYSTFIVDGPVATLHFGTITKHNSGQEGNNGDFSDKEGEEKENSNDDNLFLLAGSLCGLAFLFYEVPPPTPTASIDGNNTQISHSFFDGPVIIVDGLYDADDNEGFEDCVTSVHAMKYHNVMVLAVGTQGCRLLLFQQHELDNTRAERGQNNNNNNINNNNNSNNILTAEIEKRAEEMLHLLSEKDRLTKSANDIRQKMLEIENTVQDENVLHDDAITPSGADDDNDGGKYNTETEERVDKGDISIVSPRIESLNSIKAEIDDVEQSCSNCDSMISQLQSSIDNLTGKLNDLSSPSPQLDSKAVRKMHRYEFLWEHKLPYPIQGIGSAVCNESGSLECYITTRQTIHIFRLLSLQMVDAAAASLERKFLSFANTSNDGET